MTKRMTIALAASLLIASLPKSEAQAQTRTTGDEIARERQDRMDRDRVDRGNDRRARSDTVQLDRMLRLREQSRQRVENLSPPPARSEPANGGRRSGAPVRQE